MQMQKSILPWLVFNLNQGYYALNSSVISSIVELPDKITPLHNVPNYVHGLINYRGRVIPLLDLRQLLEIWSLEEARVASRKSYQERIIVIENNHMQMGVIVDDVNAVDSVNSVSGEDELIALMQVDYVASVGRGTKTEELILMMNDEELFQLLNRHHVFDEVIEQ